MKKQVSMEELKEMKRQEKCPSCGAELIEFGFTEDGEEFTGRKCTQGGCFWWGK